MNSAWQEKVRVEQQRTNELEKEWKCLLAQIQENADTPGYKQAMTHTDLQTGQHSKQDAPSTRVCILCWRYGIQHLPVFILLQTLSDKFFAINF